MIEDSIIQIFVREFVIIKVCILSFEKNTSYFLHLDDMLLVVEKGEDFDNPLFFISRPEYRSVLRAVSIAVAGTAGTLL